MDEKRFKINKESIDRLFPKTDPMLDYLTSTGYKSPVTTFVERINADLRSEELKAVMNATVRLGVEVDEGELLKALQYDRKQYEEGYRGGYDAGYRKATEVAEEIFAEIEKEIEEALKSNYKVLPQLEFSNELYNSVRGKIDALRGIEGFIAELKNKYTEDKKNAD